MGTTTDVQDMLDTWMEEEEQVEALKCRRSRVTTTETATPQLLPVPEEQLVAPPPPESAEPQGQQASLESETERSIYFDTNDGTWKCHHCTWTYAYPSGIINDPTKAHHHHGVVNLKTCFTSQTKGTESAYGTGEMNYSVSGHYVSTNGTRGMNFSVLGHAVADKKLGNGGSDFTPNGVGHSKTATTETNDQSHTNLKEEKQSDLHLLHSENGTTTHSPVENPHLGLRKESKQEVAEWNVERVLDEQDTHDLYCPNCNSCITKRVILRKRKRRIQNLQYDSKREKIEVVQSSSLATDDQGYNSTLPGMDGSPPMVDISDQDNVTEPDLFRCLSCFSFFIPAVASFKSFRFFGHRAERESAQNLQQIPVRTGAVKQGEEDAMQHVEEVAIEYSPTHQSDQVSSVIPVSNNALDQPVNDAALEPKEHRKDFHVSSTTSVMLEIVKNSVEEKPYGSGIKNRQGGEDAMQHVEELASEYPLIPQSDQLSLVIPVSNNALVQPVNDAALEPKEDRRDFQVSTTTSVMLEIVNNSVEEIPYGAVIRNRQDEKNATVSSLPTTFPLPVDSHANEQVDISTKNVWNDEQNGQVSSMSVSIHLVQTRIDTDDKHEDASKRTEEGYGVMHDQSADELLNPLPHLDKYVPLENSESILNKPAARFPGIPNTKFEGDPKLIPTKEGKDKHICMEDSRMSSSAGKDVILQIEAEQVRPEVSQSFQNNFDSSTPGILTYRPTEYEGVQQVDEARIPIKWDILKSIVYGGLVECITSLGVVSSAAGGDATTLNIVALGLAYLVGGLFMIAHGLMDLKNEPYEGGNNQNENADRYQELLGKRTSFRLHATVAVLSYLVFGLVAPVTYGFSFRQSGNKEYKLIAVAVASLLCITLLAIVKSYARKPPKAYIKTVLYLVSIGVTSSGLSYVMGVLVKKLLEKLGWFEQTVVDPVSSSSAFLEPMPVKSFWASY